MSDVLIFNPGPRFVDGWVANLTETKRYAVSLQPDQCIELPGIIAEALLRDYPNLKRLEAPKPEAKAVDLTCGKCGKEAKSKLGLMSHLKKHYAEENR